MKWPSFLKVKKGPQVQKLSIFLTQSKLLSHSAEKWEIHSYPFFPSNQLFSNFFSKNAAFTKFLPKNSESKFPKFPHCVIWQKFRETNTFTEEITE